MRAMRDSRIARSVRRVTVNRWRSGPPWLMEWDMRKILGALFATLFVLGMAGAASAACNYGAAEDKKETPKDQTTS